MQHAWVVAAAIAAAGIGCGSSQPAPGPAPKPAAPATAKAAPPVDAAPVPVDAEPAPVEDPCGAFAAAWTVKHTWEPGRQGTVGPLELDRVEPTLRRECETWTPEMQQCAGRDPKRIYDDDCVTAAQRDRLGKRIDALRSDPPGFAQSLPRGVACGYEALLERVAGCTAVFEEIRGALVKFWPSSSANPANPGGQTAVGITECKLGTERLRIRLARVGC